jgi:sodium/potassium/calcium exchanger 6
MAFIGFTTAIIVIYTTAKEIVNVILAFGVVFEVGSLILGVTILAVGIGMQDLVTCIGIARAGKPQTPNPKPDTPRPLP